MCDPESMEKPAELAAGAEVSPIPAPPDPAPDPTVVPPNASGSAPEPDPDVACEPVGEGQVVEQLRAEVARLVRESRAAREREELRALYPDADPSALPDEVCGLFEAGVPLAAAYAFWDRKRTVRAEDAARQNAANARTAAPGAGRSASPAYLSPEEVRAMSREEVHLRYEQILDSMRHWH